MDNGNEKNNTFFRFEDLRIYHKALNYTKWVHETTRQYTSDQDQGLTDRFDTSSQNIVLNIAEGSARNKSQFIYYLKMAKTAVRECLVFTSVFHNLELLTDAEEDLSRSQLMEMTKMIGALISSLQRSNNKREDDNDSYEPKNEMPAD
ncbi:MAG: four helix bundle protein [Bacteroidales bacterium]|nr:four helix bundle protein [Bacteroidales bacterium]